MGDHEYRIYLTQKAEFRVTYITYSGYLVVLVISTLSQPRKLTFPDYCTC